jgi:flagellar motility protein MotE (MotC chaperone)
MAWVWWGLLLVALLVAVWAGLLALGYAHLARRRASEVAVARMALLEAVTRATADQVAKEAALELLDELRTQLTMLEQESRRRAVELAHVAAEMTVLEQEYRRLVQRYTTTVARPPEWRKVD